MTRLKYALSALLLVFCATGFAEEDGYDAWNCREGEMLKGVGLQCISCGIQKYYSDKGKSEVVPSSKWLTLLAVNARQFRTLKSGAPSSTGYGTEEANAMKRVIISQIQAYGFCTTYISRDALRATGGKQYRDMSSNDWKQFTPLIKFDQEESNVLTAAKAFGFRNSSFLGIDQGKDALISMRSMFDDSHLNDFDVTQKRAVFKGKLKEALSDYDVSGERKSTPEVIAGGDKDNGLRRCLEEVQQRLNTREFSDGNQALCETMASSCQMQKGFCNKNDFSNSSGSYTPQPPSRPLGNPPSGGKPPRGVK